MESGEPHLLFVCFSLSLFPSFFFFPPLFLSSFFFILSPTLPSNAFSLYFSFSFTPSLLSFLFSLYLLFFTFTSFFSRFLSFLSILSSLYLSPHSHSHSLSLSLSLSISASCHPTDLNQTYSRIESDTSHFIMPLLYLCFLFIHR